MLEVLCSGTQQISPEELCVQRAPALAPAGLSRALQNSILSDYLSQPVPAAISHDIPIQKHQLTLWPIEPVIVGICDRNRSLKTCRSKKYIETFKTNTSVKE